MEIPQNLPPTEVLPEKTPENLPTENAPVLENQKRDSLVSKPKIPVAGSKKQPNLRQIALANYRVPDGLSGIRGASDKDTLTLATKAFFEKNYGRVLFLLSNLPENDGQEALSLRAHANFGAGNFASAARDFEGLELGGIYRREAEWFGILSQLASPEARPGSDKNLLKNDLEKIRQMSNHPFQKEAEKLWGELK